MTLADRLANVLVEQGPLPTCVLATTVRKQKAEVVAALHASPDRFVQSGKARASRWSVREVANGVGDLPTFTVDELAARWERALDLDRFVATRFVSWWIERGLLESVDGNGRVRVTELGRRKSEAWNALGNVA